MSRVTSTGTFIPEIDGLRFVAILLVVLHHLYVNLAGKMEPRPAGILSATLLHGFFGVQLFFVISGFILSKPFAEAYLLRTERPRLKDYFLRRLTRLEPPYIVNLVIFLLLLWIIKAQPLSGLTPHFLASAIYQHSLIFGEGSTINPVAWSLEVEVQFYVLVPVLVYVFAIRGTGLRRSVIVAAIVLSALCAHAVPEESVRLRGSIAVALQYFLAGFLLADFYILDWSEPRERRLVWDVAGLCGASLTWALLIYGEPSNAVVDVLLPFAVLLAYIGVFRGPMLFAIFTRRIITTIGGMCYTIYLYHWLVVSGSVQALLKIHPSRDSFWTQFAILLFTSLPILVAVSAVLFAFLERPFMKKTWPCEFWAYINRSQERNKQTH